MATSVASTSLFLLSRDNCDTEVGKQLLLVGCGNSMKLFNDHVSLSYTHVFSAHAESRPNSTFDEPLGMCNYNRLPNRHCQAL